MDIVPERTGQESALVIQAALFVDSDALNRFGRVIRHLTVGLLDQGVQLRLVSADARIEQLALGPVRALVHPRITWPMSRNRRLNVLASLSTQPPNIIHALSHGSYALSLAAADAVDADLVLQVSSLADCEAISELPHQRVGCFLAFSQSLVQILEQRLGIEPDRVALVRPGTLVAPRQACFEREENSVTILCTSRLERDAGVERLVTAVAQFRRQGHSPMLFLLGRGRREGALRRLVRDQSLASRVTFAQVVGDPTQAMRSADIFVVPAAEEAFQTDSLEAMAAGMTVVAVPGPACDHYRDGETALLCAEPTAAALANAMDKLAADRVAARQLAASAQEYVRRHHPISAMADATSQHYRRLALTAATFPLTD